MESRRAIHNSIAASTSDFLSKVKKFPKSALPSGFFWRRTIFVSFRAILAYISSAIPYYYIQVYIYIYIFTILLGESQATQNSDLPPSTIVFFLEVLLYFRRQIAVYYGVCEYLYDKKTPPLPPTPSQPYFFRSIALLFLRQITCTMVFVKHCGTKSPPYYIYIYIYIYNVYICIIKVLFRNSIDNFLPSVALHQYLFGVHGYFAHSLSGESVREC